MSPATFSATFYVQLNHLRERVNQLLGMRESRFHHFDVGVYGWCLFHEQRLQVTAVKLAPDELQPNPPRGAGFNVLEIKLEYWGPEAAWLDALARPFHGLWRIV